jgi:drug/metabolite transporter (DMT)-like permease
VDLTFAILLALGAAVLHAGWNILLKSSGDPLLVSARALSASSLVITPLVVAAWLLTGRPAVPPRAWLLGGISGAVESIYFVCLSAAYRRGDLSVVYPLARGTAPLLAVLAGFFLLGERLSTAETVGVLCLLAGIWTVRRPVVAGPALLPAILTGIAIAGYTTIDRVGVRLTEPWLYLWVLWVVSAVLLDVWWVIWRLRLSSHVATVDAGTDARRASEVLILDGGREERLRSLPGGTAPERAASSEEPRDPWHISILIGLLSIVTYFMVLLALRLAPLTIVAPLRESAIVLVTGWGIWRLKEREGAWLKLGGAAGIVAGVVLVAIQ